MSRITNRLRLVGFALIVTLAWWADSQLGLSAAIDPESVRGNAGVVSALALLAVWVLAPNVLFPTISGAALFGVCGGFAISTVGVVMGGSVQYWLARGFLREPARAWMGQRAEQMQARLAQRELGVLVIWRLLWLPVSVLAVGSAVANVPFRRYLGTTFAMVPGMAAISLASDGWFLHGLWNIPCDRVAAIASWVALGLSAYALAIWRYPTLRA
jgi:uncharacterized membrane protein YdjX (TVP38/TMEM64 family)